MTVTELNARGSLSRTTARGALWLTVQALVARVSGLLTQLILAWLLVPADFGIIGLTSTISMVVKTVVSFGVDDVLLQRANRLRLWQTSAFWASLGLATAGAILTLVVAPLGARIYHTPALLGMLAINAVSMPIGALSTVSSVTIRSKLQFRFLALYSSFETVATQLLTVAFAILHFGAYSFVWPVPLLAVAKAIVFWRRSPPNLSAYIHLKHMRYLFGRGGQIFLTRLLNETVSQGDYATLGLFSSHAVVGTYFFAFRLAAQPVRMLAGNFSNVLFPALAQLDGDRHRQIQAAVEAAELLAYLTMPICFLQAVIARPFLHIFFGQKWSGAIALIQALSVGLPFDAASWVGGSLLAAQGRFRTLALLSLFLTPVFFVVVTFGGYYASAVGVAWAVTVYYLATGPIYGAIAFSGLGVSRKTFIQLYVQPTMLAATCIGVSWSGASLAVRRTGSDIIFMIVFLALFGPCYSVALNAIRPSIIRRIGRVSGIEPTARKLRAMFLRNGQRDD